MSDPITIGVREVVELVVGLGGPMAIYVAMRERMVRMETVIEGLTKAVEKQTESRESQKNDHHELDNRVTKLEGRMTEAERRLGKISGEMHAVRE